MKKEKFANSNRKRGTAKNKAFTLIELLAIIVILAIIAVITVPIILNVIDNAKQGAAKNSVLGYAKAVELAHTEYEYKRALNNSTNPTVIDPDTAPVMQRITVKGNGGDDYVKEFGINYDGDNVTDCKATINAGKLTLKNCKVKSYNTTQKFNYADGKVTLKQSSSSSTPSFATDSWEDIVENLEDDRGIYTVGDEKEVEIDVDGNGTISNSEKFKVRLVNKTSCPSTWVGSETACGVVIEFKDIIALHEFNGTSSSYTNAGGWPATNTTNPLYTYVNDTLYNKLPSDLKSLIINTKAISGHGSSDSSNFESTDKLYLLTSGEVGLKKSNDTVELATDDIGTGKTKTLEYYVNSSGTTRIKKYNGTANWYWLRSAHSNYSNFFFIVPSDGYIDYTVAYLSGGVAPAFRILK